MKYEQVVFCHPSEFQTSLYRLFISSPEIKKLLRGVGSQPLKTINILKKLCNHPELLDLPGDLQGSEVRPALVIPRRPESLTRAAAPYSRGLRRRCSPGHAGVHRAQEGEAWVELPVGRQVRRAGTVRLSSFRLHSRADLHHACRFLHRIRTETTDKIVLISNYTQTLELFERLCREKGCVRFLAFAHRVRPTRRRHPSCSSPMNRGPHHRCCARPHSFFGRVVVR